MGLEFHEIIHFEHSNSLIKYWLQILQRTQDLLQYVSQERNNSKMKYLQIWILMEKKLCLTQHQ